MRYYVDDAGYLRSNYQYDITLTHQLLPEDSYQPDIIPWSIINHTESSGSSVKWYQLWKYLAREDITGEPHVIVDLDGHVNQNIRFTRRADNNYKANSWIGSDGKRYGALSNETQDLGSATVNQTPWTVDQFETIAQVWAAAALKYGIPLQRITGGPYARGIDGHYRYKEWSVYTGKTCPGYARQAQLDALINRMYAIIFTPTPPKNPTILTSETDEVMLNFNGMILAYNGFVIRRVKSGRAVINPQEPVDRDTVRDIIAECRVQGPNPFNGSVSGYHDPELAIIWDNRVVQGMSDGNANNYF
jgi:hypothetical protein